MARYTTRAQSWVADDVWDDPMRLSLTVCTHETIDTGLLDANGNTIWREPNAIGFHAEID